MLREKWVQQKKVNCTNSSKNHYWSAVNISDWCSITLYFLVECSSTCKIDQSANFFKTFPQPLTQGVISVRVLNYDFLISFTHFSHCISQNGRLPEAKHRLYLWVQGLWRLDVDSWTCSIWCLLIQTYMILTVCSSYPIWLVNLPDVWCVWLSESVMLLSALWCGFTLSIL